MRKPLSLVAGLLLAALGCAGTSRTSSAPLASGIVPPAVRQIAVAVPRQPVAASPVRQAAFQPASVAEVEPLPPVDASADERRTMAVDFATALALTHGQNPRVAFAQAQIRQSLAQYDAARVLWLPSLRAGMNYNKHEGRIQDVRGDNIETSRGSRRTRCLG